MRPAVVALLFLPSVASQTTWHVVWSDEFTGSSGTLPDSTKWTYDLGGGGWGNGELETYTDSPENVHLDGNGNLVIHVKSDYSSARIKTQGLFAIQYGKIEARIKIPRGQGIWPAFWMLGANIDTVGWPMCGEIDIMENIGREPSINHGSLHGPDPSTEDYSITDTDTLINGQALADDFHVYAIVWSPTSVEFLVDGTSYFTGTPIMLPKGDPWVFNAPFFIIMNVAIGGPTSWPGQPDSSTQFPQDMTIDYLRVSQAVPSIGGVVNAASFGTPIAPGSLVSIFGANLSDSTNTKTFDSVHHVFARGSQGVEVYVGGKLAPLTYVDPAQINLQIPWEIPTGTRIPVQVVRDGVNGNSFDITLSPTAPSAFASSGVAVLSCLGGAPKPGMPCTLWGNGFGQTNPAQEDGTPSSLSPLPKVIARECQLTIGGSLANVTYCGAAPYEIIDQLNFNYPSVSAEGPTVPATLTIGDSTGTLLFPLAH